MNYINRIDKLRTAMAAEGLDAVVYGTGANLSYLTGLPVAWQREHEPLQPTCLFVLVQDSEPVIILDPSLQALAAATKLQTVVAKDEGMGAALSEVLKDSHKIGLGKAPFNYLQELIKQGLSNVECLEAKHLVVKLRQIKDADEIKLLRKLAVMTDTIMGKVIPHLQQGITQTQIRDLLIRYGGELGAEDFSFIPTASFVKSGTEASSEPFVYPNHEGLAPGTSIAFDFGFVLQGYCSDFGRSFYYGAAPEHIAGAYSALQDAVCHLYSVIKPGQTRINDLFGIVEAFLDQRGYGDRLRARLANGTLGHQIGIDVHEDPWIKPSNDDILYPGMVMCIEPKLWHAGEYYLRVEDMVLITETGAESLTVYDRKQFVL